jgi:hypothetical protein
MSDETPKIFVDEDWKARVQREREEAARKAAEAEAAKAEAPAAGAEAVSAPLPPLPQAGAPDGTPEEDEPVEANFSTLVASIATQAMFALGMLPQPGEEQVYVNLDQAHFSLETLVMLREKTQGNLSPEESAYLEQALMELDRVFQARIMQFQQQAMQQAGIDPNQLRPR